jgi:protein-disulfide isomerase
MSTRSTARQTRARQRAQAAQAKRRRTIMLGAGITIALVVAIALIATNRSGANLPELQTVAAADTALPTNGRTIGDPVAPVHLIEYGDYQCPACAAVDEQVIPQLLDEYVATGQVLFEFRDLAFLGQESTRAAEAAACAVDQDAFWPFHTTVYGNHHGENLGNLSKERLLQMAQLAGLDRNAMESCLDDGRYKAQVEAMAAEAAALGINSTPSFVLNGTVIPWQGYASLKGAIDAALAS